MVNDEKHEVPLRYGRTDGENLLFMPKGKFFSVGYNPRYGLVDVCEDNGDPFFEGRVNIKSLLSGLQSEDQKEVDSKVDDYIMRSYDNYMWNTHNRPEHHVNSSEPVLEVLTDSR